MYSPSFVGVHVAVADVLLIVCPSFDKYEYLTVPSAFSGTALSVTASPTAAVVLLAVNVAPNTFFGAGNSSNPVSSSLNNFLSVAAIVRPSPLGY